MLSCKQRGAVSCAEDAHVRSYARRYGPASDAEFLRSIADKTPGRDDVDGARQMRHVYLKSYVFVTKDDAAAAKDEANYAIMDKTRRVVVGAVSRYLVLPSMALLHRRPTRSRPRKSAARGSNYLLSQLLSRLRACTGTGTGRHKQPSSSSDDDGDAADAN